ncbi:flagellar hook-length control protein FliK [Selenomonas sp. oral taxon 136]|uniref:flagellar hook-length control protein FliK n=1 Tax=Selenomonas sp. oral taxon 136 TaxID=713030 RepID=UPI000767E3B8|nr:flagellar hook-length control protein FliK [Selenomonas sp. oral taxon 136]AME02846.1 flagellar hook-length control protein [Selenomonas sp. oral taxon 136]
MNAGNLMAVSTTDGASTAAGVQGARSAAAGSRTQTTSGKNTFSDTMGALQKKGMSADATKIQTGDSSLSAVQDKPAATGTDGMAQNAQDVKKTASMPAAKGQSDALKDVSAEDTAIASAAAATVLTALLPADVEQVPVESTPAEGELPPALADILERYGLTAEQLRDTKLQTAVEHLLQQMPQTDEKGNALLCALAGEPLTQETANTAVMLAQTDAPAAAAARLAALDAAMPAQLRAALQAAALPSAEDAATVPVAVTDETPVSQLVVQEDPVPAAPAEQPTVVQQPAVQAAAVSAMQEQQTLPREKSAAALVGEHLTEETQPAPSPLDVLAQRTMRHDAMQRDMSGENAEQNQQPMQSGIPQPAPTHENVSFETTVRTAETPVQLASVQTETPPVQTEQAAPAAEVPQRPQTDYEIPRQIVEQARLLRTLNDTQMIIRLKPEHLGELTLRVAVGSDGAVQASFHSDNAHVRSVIENSLVQLRQELNTQGIKVDRVGVYTGLADGQMPQGQGQEAWQQHQAGHSETQVYARGDADDYLDGEIVDDGVTPASIQESVGGVTADGVDYRV